MKLLKTFLQLPRKTLRTGIARQRFLHSPILPSSLTFVFSTEKPKGNPYSMQTIRNSQPHLLRRTCHLPLPMFTIQKPAKALRPTPTPLQQLAMKGSQRRRPPQTQAQTLMQMHIPLQIKLQRKQTRTKKADHK